MTEYLVFAVLGLGAGALTAGLAQGLILAYRGSGVVNIGHGAMAMYIAYFYQALREGLVLLPPLPNPLAWLEAMAGWFGVEVSMPSIPPFVRLSNGDAGLPLSLFMAAVMAIVLGGIVHLAVFRPLRARSPLAKTVAATGVALTLQAIVLLRFGADTIAVAPILPSTKVSVFGSIVPLNRFLILVLVLVIACSLAALFRYSRIGIETRAASENERAAMFIGLSPNRLASLNWMLSSLVAGLAGILFSSITGLNPTDLVLLVIPALGAALVARFQSFVLGAVAGVLIGVLQSLMLPLQADLPWLPSAGLSAGVPLIVIVLAMVLRGDTMPGRGGLERFTMPTSTIPRHPIRVTFVLATLVVIGLLVLPFDFRGGLINSLAGVILAQSLMVIVGMAGQISLMQMATAGLAALAMTRAAGDWGLHFPVSPLLAIAAAALVGTIAGLPALRVRGVQLAVLTLGAAYAFENMVLGNSNILRESDAYGSIPSPAVASFEFGVNSPFPWNPSGPPSVWFGLFVLAVVIATSWTVIWLRRSALGLRMLAVRANERAAAALGVNVARTKLVAFGISSALAGVAGVLTGYRFDGVSASQYVAMASIGALAVAYIGGISQISGTLVAGVIVTGGLTTVVIERLFDLGRYQPLFSGLVLLVAVILNPNGVVGAMTDVRQHLRSRAAARQRRQLTADAPEAEHPDPVSADVVEAIVD